MNRVARFITSGIWLEGGEVAVCPTVAVADAVPASSAAARTLRARLDIRHRREQATFLAARIVDAPGWSCRTPSSRAVRGRRRASAGGPAYRSGCARTPRTSRSSARPAAPFAADADFLGHERHVVEDERHVEAVMGAPPPPSIGVASRTGTPRCAAARPARRAVPRSMPGRATIATRSSTAKNTSAGEYGALLPVLRDHSRRSNRP